MKRFILASACLAAVFPGLSQAAVGVCENEDGTMTLSVMTNDRGELIDLALVVGNTLSRFPEANSTSMNLSSHRYKFSAKKEKRHPAVAIDISGETARLTYAGKMVNLECGWQ